MRLGAKEGEHAVPLSGTNGNAVSEAEARGTTFGRMDDDRKDFSASE